jgi:hypothetical protein
LDETVLTVLNEAAFNSVGEFPYQTRVCVGDAGLTRRSGSESLEHPKSDQSQRQKEGGSAHEGHGESKHHGTASPIETGCRVAPRGQPKCTRKLKTKCPESDPHERCQKPESE